MKLTMNRTGHIHITPANGVGGECLGRYTEEARVILPAINRELNELRVSHDARSKRREAAKAALAAYRA